MNISTLGAIVVAGAGVLVAKHGNRAASSRCGSADLLEALEVRIDLGPAGVERCLAEAGIAFLFAPVFHPAMAHAMPIRPRAPRPHRVQLPGAPDEPRPPAAQVVGRLGPEDAPGDRAGAGRRRRDPGLGSAAPTAWTSSRRPAHLDVFDVRRRAGVATERLHPRDLGPSRATLEDLRGGDVEENVAQIARAVLRGERGPRRDVVLLERGRRARGGRLARALVEGMANSAASIDDGRRPGLCTRAMAPDAPRPG